MHLMGLRLQGQCNLPYVLKGCAPQGGHDFEIVLYIIPALG